jgi:hypothetical protein
MVSWNDSGMGECVLVEVICTFLNMIRGSRGRRG